MRRSDTAALVVALTVVAGVAALGATATATSVESWYPSLAKPPWTPPSWLFGPVWTALYAVMAVAAWLVWRTRAPARRAALAVFAVQLVLNGLWSWLFFGWHEIGLALVDVALLWLAIIATIRVFARVRTAAAWLLVPYLAWVSFAMALTLAIWRLNA